MPGRVDGTDMMFFIDENKIPRNRQKDVTYGRIVYDSREGKAEQNRKKVNRGRRPHQLPMRCGHTHGMITDIETVSQ